MERSSADLRPAGGAAPPTDQSWHALTVCELAYLSTKAWSRLSLLAKILRLRAKVAEHGCTCSVEGSSGLACACARAGASAGAAAAPASLAQADVGWLDLRTELFTREPRVHLRALCAFLAVPCPESFLASATAVVRPARSATAELLRWPQQLVDAITGRLRKMTKDDPSLLPLLGGYIGETPFRSGATGSGDLAQLSTHVPEIARMLTDRFRCQENKDAHRRALTKLAWWREPVNRTARAKADAIVAGAQAIHDLHSQRRRAAAKERRERITPWQPPGKGPSR